MADRINMADIVEGVAEELEIPRSEVREIVKTFFDIVAEELKEGNNVRLTPYLSFSFRYSPPIKKGTKTRNPFTGEEYPRPEAKPAQIKVRARALSAITRAAPSPATKAGKGIADAAKAKAKAA